MHHHPRVSISIPCYNQESTIADTLDSILSQSYPDLEIIAIDDASTDGTAAILHEYQRRFPNILRVKVQARNLGPVASYLSIASSLTGKYVIFFAGDDLFSRGRLERQVAFMEEHPEIWLSYGRADFFDGRTGKSLYYSDDPFCGLRIAKGDLTSNLIRYGCFITVITAMVRAEKLNQVNHRPEFYSASDWVLMVEISAHGAVGYIPEVLARYRRHPNNLTARVDEREEVLGYALIESLYPNRIVDVQIGRTRLYTNQLFKNVFAGNPKRAAAMLSELKRIIFKNPERLGAFFEAILRETMRRSVLLARTGSLFR
jgi:glycosyltransferase involved in cell wall biosynthesis